MAEMKKIPAYLRLCPVQLMSRLGAQLKPSPTRQFT
jgi:hypothetical protein